MCSPTLRFFLPVFAWLVLTPFAPGQDRSIMHLSNGIAANAEGTIITLQELRKELEPMIPRVRLETKNESEFNQRISKLSKEVLQNMIDRIIISKAAEEKGLQIPSSYIDQEYNETITRDFNGDRGKFLDFLKQQGKTPNDYREDIYRRVVVSVMRQQNRQSKSEISPERIQEFYLKNKLRFYQEEAMHLRQIILNPLNDNSRQLTQKILSELDTGAHFGDLANKYSQDNMNRNRGDWGWVNRTELRKELSQSAFALEPGQYSKPIELNDTIFILYCEEKREEIIQPVTQVRDIIEKMLVGQIARETQERWLKALRQKAYIRYYI